MRKSLKTPLGVSHLSHFNPCHQEKIRAVLPHMAETTTQNAETESDENVPQFLDLSALGIDEEMINVAKPILLKFIADFAHGAPQFAAEEKTIRERLLLAVEKKRDLLTQIIFSVRAFLLTLIGFSLTIIGIVLSVLMSDKHPFGISHLHYVGLVFLGLNVICAVLYILFIHTIESNWLLSRIRFDESLLKELSDLIGKYYLDPTKTYADYLLAKKKAMEIKSSEEATLLLNNPLTIKGKDWMPHFISAFFLIGILLIVGAFFWH
jgi:hypothetical protein